MFSTLNTVFTVGRKYPFFLLFLVGFLPMLSAQSRLNAMLHISGQARVDSLESYFTASMEEPDTNLTLKEMAIVAKFATKNKGLEAVSDWLYAMYHDDQMHEHLKESDAYWERALKAAPTNALPLVQATIEHYWAKHLLFQKKQGKEAIVFFRRADLAYRRTGYAKIWGGGRKLSLLAEAYLRSGESAIALPYYQEGEPLIHLDKNDRQRINFYNSFALCNQLLKRHEQAIQYFNKIPVEVRLKRDSAWIGIAAGNIGSIYILNPNQPLKAEPFILKDLSYTLKYSPTDTTSLAASYGSLCSVAGAQQNPKMADFYYKKAENLLKNYSVARNGDWMSLYYVRLKADALLKDYKSAFFYQGLYQDKKDSVMYHRNLKKVKETTVQYDAERNKLNAELAEKKASVAQFWVYFFISMFGLAILSAFFIYNRARKIALQAELDYEKLQRAIQQEQQNADLAQLKLQNAQQQLDDFMKNIIQKNELIENLSIDILHLKQLKNEANDNEIIAQRQEQQKQKTNDSLDSILKSTLLTDDDWTYFRTLFLQVHPDFLNYLEHDFAHLSQSDTRLLVLLKLKFSNRQIATTLAISVDSVYKSRYRLRQKLGNLPETNEILQLLK